MSRYPRNPIPHGLCNGCARPCWAHQNGSACQYCAGGVYVHRRFWVFWQCPACHGVDPFCTGCHGRGVVATPREDIDEESAARALSNNHNG